MKHFLAALVASACALAASAQDVGTDNIARHFSQSMLTEPRWRAASEVRVDSVSMAGGRISVYFNAEALSVPQRAERLDALADSVCRWAGCRRGRTQVRFMAGTTDLSTLVPNAFRTAQAADTSRQPLPPGKPWFTSTDLPSAPRGLGGRCIALWNSHGYYYESRLDRWEWQRARLFGTVEDLLSTSIVLPYLVPMLENAGACVLMPRERCLQAESVIVDNDATPDAFAGTARLQGSVPGYRPCARVGEGVNPFALGTAGNYRFGHDDSLVVRIAHGTMCGPAALYVSYACQPKGTTATYRIRGRRHSTVCTVDQTRGGSGWTYLCTVDAAENDSTTIVVRGRGGISVDAFRLGGGMGCVERSGSTSGKPAWMEAARYCLQAGGAPAAVYTPSNGTNDYTDDINARGLWVNMLVGRGIPVDMALALHTDAGMARADTTIGTLAIACVHKGPELRGGKPRLISRDLADCIQTAVVDDARALWDSHWSRRQLQDKSYSEARRPQVPSVLIELLSHQNINDMRLGLNPEFRSDMARAIYKGIATFLGGPGRIIQPLPVRCIGIDAIGAGRVRVVWQATVDSLEATAVPTHYKVRHTSGASESIVSTADTFAVFDIGRDGQIHTFSITAVNDGGQSAESPTMAACINGDAPMALVVDAFTRVDAPAVVATETFGGIMPQMDPGVPDRSDRFGTGAQYDFDPQSPWTDDDSPGFGASHADREGQVSTGNTADVSLHHGQMLKRCGFSFVSQTRSFFEQAAPDSTVRLVDIACGNQKSTVRPNGTVRHSIYTPAFRHRLQALSLRRQAVIISGSHIGTDLRDSVDQAFAIATFGFGHRTNHASALGTLTAGSRTFGFAIGRYGTRMAAVPDAIEPAGGHSRTLLRYADSKASAAVLDADKRTIAVGIPLETAGAELMQFVADTLLGRPQTEVDGGHQTKNQSVERSGRKRR